MCCFSAFYLCFCFSLRFQLSCLAELFFMANAFPCAQGAVLQPSGLYPHYQTATHVAACVGGSSGLAPGLEGASVGGRKMSRAHKFGNPLLIAR